MVFYMKKLYIATMAVMLSVSVSAGNLQRSLCKSVAGVAAPETSAAYAPMAKMQIIDLKTQVQGRYALEYYSPVPDENGTPYGNCYEQPMIVESYFAEEPGDVNVGYLFLQNAILKGHIDMEAGTITIPSCLATVYYEDPDDLDDPGLDIYFTAVDYVDGKYVPNLDRPFIGTFELYNGVITKIVTDDVWGYAAYDSSQKQVGWMEIGVNSRFYLGHGEMQYGRSDAPEGSAEEQTIVHAVSNGTTATVYNAFRSGWEAPVTINIDKTAKQATIKDQTILLNGTDATLTTTSHDATVTGIIRDVDWDTDYRDERPNSVLDFGAIAAYDVAVQKDIVTFSNVRFYFAEDVTAGSSAIDKVEVEENAPAEYYTIAGVRVSEASLTPGFYICRQGRTARVIAVR